MVCIRCGFLRCPPADPNRGRVREEMKREKFMRKLEGGGDRGRNWTSLSMKVDYQILLERLVASWLLKLTGSGVVVQEPGVVVVVGARSVVGSDTTGATARADLGGSCGRPGCGTGALLGT